MIFKSLSKIAITTLTASVTGTGVIVPTATYIVKNIKNENNNKENNSKVLLPSNTNGTIAFNSIDEAVDYVLKNEQTLSTLKNSAYIGDFSDVGATNKVNLKKVHELGDNQLLPAYKMANGQFTSDINQAISSFVGAPISNYKDANGNIHSDYTKAKEINKYISETRNVWGVSFYEIKDYSSNKTIRINPLNKEDIATFKKIAIRNLSNSSSGFTIDKVYQNNLLDGTIFVPASDVLVSQTSRDDMISTVFDIMNVLSQEKDKYTYNFDVQLANNASVLSEYKYIPDKNANAQFMKTKSTSPSYQKYIDMHYTVYRGNFEKLDQEKFNEYASKFINPQEFKASAKQTSKAMYIYEEYKGVFGGLTCSNRSYDGWNYEIDVGGQNVGFSLSRELSDYDNDRYCGFDSQVVGLNEFTPNMKANIYTMLNVTTNQDVINTEEVVKKVADILKEKLIFKGIDHNWYKTNKDIIESINDSVDKYAKRIVTTFLSATRSTSLSWNSNASLITKSVTDNLTNTANSTIDSKLAELRTIVDKNWWVQDLYNSGVLEEISSFANAISQQLDPVLKKQSYIISYNGVPTFMIEDTDKISSRALYTSSDISSALDSWLNSGQYDGSLMVNLSNKLKYDEGAKTVVYAKERESLTTYDTNNFPSQHADTFKYIRNNGGYSESDLTRGQNLLLSNSDSQELLRNDTGVESAINLYNKNIDKMINLNNSQYVNSVESQNICDLDVLRLYKPQSKYQDKRNFLVNPLPVYYGVLRAYNGTFNPAVANRSIIVHQSEVDQLSNYVEPSVVPVVEISGKKYIISELVNGEDSILNGSVEDLKENLINYLLKYMKADESKVYLSNNGNDSLENRQILVDSTIRNVTTVKLNLGALKDDLFVEKELAFLWYNDLVDYVKAVLIKANAVYQ